MKCNKCGRKTRGVIFFKGEYLCGNCRSKRPEFKAQQSATQIGKGHIKLSEALNRTYEPICYPSNPSSLSLHLPICLREKKIKIILADSPDYEKGFNILMDYFNLLPDEDKEELDERLRGVGL